MAEIPWWAWIGVGLFVAVSAGIMGGRVSLFAWVGLLFIAIGIGKIVYLFVLKPRESEKEKNVVHQHPVLPPARFCPRCRVAVQVSDIFCRYCGWRLR